MGAANVINATYPPVLRAANTHQTDSGLLYVPPSLQILSPPSDLGVTTRYTFREGLYVRNFDLNNRSGSTASVGIGGRIANRHWIGGRLSADGATFTDLTSSMQSSTLTATLQVTGANQTGFIIGCKFPFDWVSVNITMAETDDDSGGEINHTVQYSNAAGTGWTNLGVNAALTDGFTLTGTPYAAAATNLVVMKPSDWGKWTSTVLPKDYYYLRFTSVGREASDVAAVATGIEIGQLLALESVADNGIWEMETVDFWMPTADGIVAYFSVANAGNRVYAEVVTR
jgi:hypothetical protein